MFCPCPPSSLQPSTAYTSNNEPVLIPEPLGVWEARLTTFLSTNMQ